MSNPHTGLWAANAPDPEGVSDNYLQVRESLAIPADATAATLTFWHHFDFEHNDTFMFDGGVLEVSTDDGLSWTDASANITVGGYNGMIDDPGGHGNPLANRAAWVSTMADWAPVSVDIMPYRGQSFTFRWRLGTDDSNFGTFGGWWLDDVELRYEVPLGSCERSWGVVTSYPVPAQAAAAVVHNGTLYVFGGMIGDESAIAAAHKYSVEDDEWPAIAPLPAPRFGASAVSDGTYIYVLGGSQDGNGNSNLWRYDPAADSYVDLEPFTTATVDQGAVYLDGTIYRIAGRQDAGRSMYTATVEAYTIASHSWRAVAEHPFAFGEFAAMTLGGYIYTAGGGLAAIHLAKTYRYDPTSNVWDDGPIADLPTKALTLGAVYKGNWIVLANEFPLSWNPAINRWRSLDEIPQHTVAASAAATVSTFFLIGGDNVGGDDEGPLDSAQIYEEIDCTTPTVTATRPSPTATPPPGGACAGDCGGDRMVSVAELVRGVSIALGLQSLDGCPAFDGNRDGAVAVNELVAAVNNALNGCV